jgi:hypothetical protein
MMSRHILCEDVGYNIHTSMLTQNSSVSQSVSQKGENLTANQYFHVLTNLISLLHINFFAEGNDERGARIVPANASQSCFQRTASLQVAYLA